MKKIILVLLVLSLGFSVQAQNTKTKKKKKKKFELKNDVDSLSYAVGLTIMKNLQDQGMENIDIAAYMRGMEDWLDSSTMMTSTAANQYASDYFNRRYQEKLEETKLPQLQWLEENKTKEGVIVLESGLQYKILKAGDGPIPKALNTVKVHYTGMLIDGTVFDSSYERNEPIEFAVTGVIQGWQEALQLMPVGSKWELYIPFHLAYGEQGAGNTIPPYATLKFIVELLEVK